MRFLRRDERRIAPREVVIEKPGLAEWALKLVRSWRGGQDGQQKEMQLVETLGLGGKRQLMLVTCNGERFLVGGGLESIETIVRVRADSSLCGVIKTVDEICR